MINPHDILHWLREEDQKRLEELWQWADTVRRENVGDEVHLRGLIEISNHCIRQCGYCGVRFGNKELERYRMSEEEIMACVGSVNDMAYGTAVSSLARIMGSRRNGLLTLSAISKEKLNSLSLSSLGERPDEDLETWRKAGADRYLLCFETSDEASTIVFIHPSPEENQIVWLS
jgi:biotin synthase